MHSLLYSIFILFLPYIIYSLKCTDAGTITSRYDCFSREPSPSSLCCYTNDNNCVEVKQEELVEKEKNNINIDCGVVDDDYDTYNNTRIVRPEDKKLGQNINLKLYTCGENEQPLEKDDCTEYSELSNSCCIFSTDKEFSKQENNGCYNIGQKYKGGKGVQTFKIDDKDIYFECKGMYMSIGKISLIFLGFIFVNLI